VKNGRIGFAQANGDIKALDLVNMALETCQFGHEANYRFPSQNSYSEVAVFDGLVEDFSIDYMVKAGEAIIDAVRTNTPDIICEGAISRGTAIYNIANTSGGRATYRRSNFSISMDGMLVRDDDILYVGDILSSCHPITEYKGMIEEIIRQLELARNNVSITSELSLSYSRRSEFQGPSCLRSYLPSTVKPCWTAPHLLKKERHAVFDSKFSLHDDPTIPFQPGSTPCDDEGVPARKNTLVDKGTVMQYYYDLHTAALAGTTSTGNGNRNGGLPALPHMPSL
jgi:PmbA protein